MAEKKLSAKKLAEKINVHITQHNQWRDVNVKNVRDVIKDKNDSISARDVRSPIFTAAPFENRGKAWSTADLAKLSKLKSAGYSNIYCAAVLHRPICAIESRGIKMKASKILNDKEKKIESDYLSACARAMKNYKAKK